MEGVEELRFVGGLEVRSIVFDPDELVAHGK